MKTSKASVCSLDFPSGRKFQEDLKGRVVFGLAQAGPWGETVLVPVDSQAAG